MVRSEKGFTLIELMTVIVIIGILAGLGIQSFSVYKASAAYGVANKTLRDARTVLEASVANYDSPPSSVPLTVQSSAGPIQDSNAHALLPQMMIPRDVSFQVEYDSSCVDSSCQQQFMQVNHCKGDEYVRYVRFGDGVDVLMEHLAGVGCS